MHILYSLYLAIGGEVIGDNSDDVDADTVLGPPSSPSPPRKSIRLGLKSTNSEYKNRSNNKRSPVPAARGHDQTSEDKRKNTKSSGESLYQTFIIAYSINMQNTLAIIITVRKTSYFHRNGLIYVRYKKYFHS